MLGYLAITLEHTLKIDKLIPALTMMALLWAIVSLAHLPVFEVDTALKQLVPSKLAELSSTQESLEKFPEAIAFIETQISSYRHAGQVTEVQGLGKSVRPADSSKPFPRGLSVVADVIEEPLGAEGVMPNERSVDASENSEESNQVYDLANIVIGRLTERQ